jgi:hypothetical protein
MKADQKVDGYLQNGEIAGNRRQTKTLELSTIEYT